MSDLIFQLFQQKEEDFAQISVLGMRVSRYRARRADSDVPTCASLFHARLLVKHLGAPYCIPTSSQWDEARKHFQRTEPSIERHNFLRQGEIVDGILAFPNPETKQYDPALQIPDVKPGKHPLLIMDSEIKFREYKREEDSFIVRGGKVIEVPGLPLNGGYIQKWDEDLGLPAEVGKKPNKDFHNGQYVANPQGLQAILRGGCIFGEEAARFDTCLSPAYRSSINVGFRLGRTI